MGKGWFILSQRMILLGVQLHQRPEASAMNEREVTVAMNEREVTALKQHVVVEADCHLVVIIITAVGE